jgi:thiol-disulfide isomerase/thioredoxin
LVSTKIAPLSSFAFVAMFQGCDKGADAVATTRSEQVIATAAAPSTPNAPLSVTAPHPAPTTHAPRRLCEGDADAKGRVVPKVAAGHAEAPGAQRLDGSLPGLKGAWTWINFWAAWCGPCKEEIPRLLGWQDKLSKGGTPVHFVFVSIDDDDRQLGQFLEQQPQDGLRATLWLPDGPTRAAWLQSFKMKSAPDLPEQAVIDPQGHVRCFIEGAVDDGDYAEIAALVGR